jgi:hypothetical protein
MNCWSESNELDLSHSLNAIPQVAVLHTKSCKTHHQLRNKPSKMKNQSCIQPTSSRFLPTIIQTPFFEPNLYDKKEKLHLIIQTAQQLNDSIFKLERLHKFDG